MYSYTAQHADDLLLSGFNVQSQLIKTQQCAEVTSHSISKIKQQHFFFLHMLYSKIPITIN